MKKIAQLSLIIALSLMAIACTSDEDDDLLEIVYDEELYEDGVIDPSSKYRFILSDDGILNIRLKGDVGEIKVSGIGNYITIENDEYIEKLTIQGDTNIVDEDVLNVTIDTITIAGSDNIILISECTEWTATGENNSAPVALNCDTSEP